MWACGKHRFSIPLMLLTKPYEVQFSYHQFPWFSLNDNDSLGSASRNIENLGKQITDVLYLVFTEKDTDVGAKYAIKL